MQSNERLRGSRLCWLWARDAGVVDHGANRERIDNSGMSGRTRRLSDIVTEVGVGLLAADGSRVFVGYSMYGRDAGLFSVES